ncbi:hypothetical protein OZX65_01085 [Leuconostocaceae bacterium ESL0723]|nr:hypothetical protein OZX65_01085 [Leuconostocaceae bacterium ESL0723]
MAFLLVVAYQVATIIPWLSLQYRRFNDTSVPKWLYVVAPVATVFTFVGNFSSAGWVWGIVGVTWLVIFVVSVLPTDDDDEY